MATFDVTFTDGSRELFDADYHEHVGDKIHFVRQAGGSGEERWTEVDAARIATISKLAN